jgi:DHA1 family inner membrane transport protein
MVFATRIAPEGRQTSAVSLVIAGVTLANILGVPIGTALGNAFSWRAAFWAIAAAGAVAVVVLAWLIPETREAPPSRDRLKAELGAAARPAVLLCYAISICYTTGVFALMAYIVPLLTTVSGVGIDMVPWVLFGTGFVGFFGNLIGGRLGDWNGRLTMLGILVINITLCIVMFQVASFMWGALLCLWGLWLVGFGFPAIVRTRIVKESRDAPTFAATLTSSAFNIGIASGAALGGLALSAGWSYATLPLLTAGAQALSLVGTLALLALDRRSVAVAGAA